MTKQIEALRQWVGRVGKHRLFRQSRGIHRIQNSGFCTWTPCITGNSNTRRKPSLRSHSFYVRRKAEFYDFYRAKMLAPWAEPNAAHRKLAQWEQEGRLKAVITQNIDGLHRKASFPGGAGLTAVCCGSYCEVRGPLRAGRPSCIPPACPGAPPAAGTCKPQYVVLYERESGTRRCWPRAVHLYPAGKP